VTFLTNIVAKQSTGKLAVMAVRLILQVAKIRSSPEDYMIAAHLIHKNNMVDGNIDFTVDITNLLSEYAAPTVQEPEAAVEATEEANAEEAVIKIKSVSFSEKEVLDKGLLHYYRAGPFKT